MLPLFVLSLLLFDRSIHVPVCINFDFAVVLPLQHSTLGCFGAKSQSVPPVRKNVVGIWHVKAFLLQLIGFLFLLCTGPKKHVKCQSRFTNREKDVGVVLHSTLEQEGCFLAVLTVFDKTPLSRSTCGGFNNVGCFLCSVWSLSTGSLHLHKMRLTPFTSS